MKKKSLALIMAALMSLSMLTACSSGAKGGDEEVTAEPAERTTFNIAGLKGPTTMGMVKLMSDNDNEEARHDYNVTMYGSADEIVPLLVSGDLDVAAIPANLAATLYAKTEGAIEVAAINTLGVLYVVEKGDSVTSVADLAGKTIYTTGKGTTPEYVLNYILTENGINPETDVTIEYKSEATEVASVMQSTDEDVIAMLPQPYVTALQAQVEGVNVVLNMTEEWGKVSEDSQLVTGVLVARKDFVEQNEAAFNEFLEDYSASTTYVNENVEDAAQLVADYGIIEKAPVAVKAIPNCNITYIDGADMKAALSGYLNVLFEQNNAAVGGAMPDDAFYYNAE